MPSDVSLRDEATREAAAAERRRQRLAARRDRGKVAWDKDRTRELFRRYKEEGDAEAREQLIDMGFSAKYGGREVDRVIQAQVKTRLMREILFGALKNGGVALLGYSKGQFTLKCD